MHNYEVEDQTWNPSNNIPKCERFKILEVVKIYISIFSVMPQCGLLHKWLQMFQRTILPHLHGWSMSFRNSGNHLPDHSISQTRRPQHETCKVIMTIGPVLMTIQWESNRYCCHVHARGRSNTNICFQVYIRYLRILFLCRERPYQSCSLNTTTEYRKIKLLFTSTHRASYYEGWWIFSRMKMILYWLHLLDTVT